MHLLNGPHHVAVLSKSSHWDALGCGFHAGERLEAAFILGHLGKKTGSC